MAAKNDSQNQGLAGDALGDDFLESIDLADYPFRQFSFGDIRKAGKLLASDIPADSATQEDVLKAFHIAHNWRMSHAYPMIAERVRLAKIAEGGMVTAGRVKRMTSIRKKLKRGSTDLRAMQDLGGCRAVMRNLDEVYRVVAAYEAGASRTHLSKVTDYMVGPKADGYRGVHLICRFDGSSKGEVFNGQSLEIQVRTATQHVWATAIETVGAIRNEDLKAGKGDPSWLRLMALMGHYMALHDGLPLHSDFSSMRDLCDEIASLAAATRAVEVVDAFQAIVRSPASVGGGSAIYELFFDARSGRVEARRQTWLDVSDRDFGTEMESSQHVVVSVDRVEDLRRAFPNFYLDVSAFRGHLAKAVTETAHRYISKKQARAANQADLSFLLPSGKIRK